MDLLSSDDSSLGILLEFQSKINQKIDSRTVSLPLQNRKIFPNSKTKMAFIGAGNYANRNLIPAFKKVGVELDVIASKGGVSAFYTGRKFGFKTATTNLNTILEDQSIKAVVIATRHSDHAEQVLAALRAGKHVFCEKPLCLKLRELKIIEEEIGKRPNQYLMVGFNRRFSPLVQKMKSLLIEKPMTVLITVNAGHIASEHWTQNESIGGGRLLGEACHFIDF